MPYPPNAETTAMFAEAAEAADVVREQLARTAGDLERLAKDLKDVARAAVVTLARGSSDHAATYARYLLETRAGVLTASLSPSVSSVYASRAHLRNTAVLAISQSGRSPDILETARAAGEAGACVVALVNAEDSPLAGLAHYAIPLCAGRETSVAATKSFIASLSAAAHLAARWSGDARLHASLDTLPDTLREAWTLDWSPAITPFTDAHSLYVVARGLGLGVAQEAALKFKETCGLHAEAISAAELRHGPLAIVGADFPVLMFAQDDQTRPDLRMLSADLAAQGAKIIAAGLDGEGLLVLPGIDADPAVQPILQIQSFYRMVSALAIERGRDPDRPPHLRKVTETT